MHRRTRLLVVALALALASLQPIAVAQAESAAPRGEVEAYLDGVSIPSTEAGDYFCHDFDFPTLDCYSTAAALEAAVAVLTTDGGPSATAAYGPSDYVTVYSEPGYGGSYAHLAQSYDALWVIGWNDQISSFKARNSATGSFYVDWYAGGQRLDFCCNSTVPQLSGTFDNAISSVYRR